jgi:protein SCO1
MHCDYWDIKTNMSKRPSYTLLFILTIVLGIAVVASFVFARPYTFHGTVITPPLPVTDFSLQTASDKSFQLSDQQGKLVVLFFGYTSCPDVCPTTLATFTQVHDSLGDHAQKVRFVMITADPERDTPEKVAAYVKQFNSEFIGLSGSLEDLGKIWKELGVFVEKQDSNDAGSYLVSHTGNTYVLDQNGDLIMTLPYATDPFDIADDLTELLKQMEKK